MEKVESGFEAAPRNRFSLTTLYASVLKSPAPAEALGIAATFTLPELKASWRAARSALFSASGEAGAARRRSSAARESGSSLGADPSVKLRVSVPPARTV